MPVSGLVVSLSDRDDARENAIAAIRQESRIEIGAIHSRRMAVVMDTDSSDEDKELWNWLSTLPGVVFVDVVMVGFEDEVGRQIPVPELSATELPLRERKKQGVVTHGR